MSSLAVNRSGCFWWTTTHVREGVARMLEKEPDFIVSDQVKTGNRGAGRVISSGEPSCCWM